MAECVVGAIIGPTASGKSELAIQTCERIGGEVVSADAYQIYRELDIGTGKPPRERRGGIRHHLIDAIPGNRALTVADFQALGRAAIDDCQRRGAVPVLAGGSALYIRALIDDFDFPGTDPQIRSNWQTELNRLGPEGLHRVLAQRDPDAATHILPSNGRRIVRALEVGELTSRGFQAQLPSYDSVYDDLHIIGIRIDRQLLDERIARRVNTMWDRGWPSEVDALIGRGLCNWPTASRALGYRQVADYIQGRTDRHTAIQSIITATQKFARRQLRIFQRDPRIVWLDHNDPHLIDRAAGIMAVD